MEAVDRGTHGDSFMKWITSLTSIAIYCTLFLASSNTSAADPARVLIVTGIDYPGHVWRETAPVIRTILEDDPGLTVRIVEDPHFLDSPTIGGYDVILLHFQNWEEPGPGSAARENLRRYVENGGGLVSVHFACGAWHGEWPEFEAILGRVWHGREGAQHDPRGTFVVRIIDGDHPVTRGIEDFETDDELYTCLTGESPIHVLAEATSIVDGRGHPMAFVRRYGQGRVFVTTLGHDTVAFTSGAVPQLIRQACQWAAGR
jgi:uncharacterized protein